jgi:hypothetical protein
MKPLKEITLTPENLLDKDFVKLCKSVRAKRARTVICHILKHGIINTEELSQIYNYDHPPRAVRDVRENGIPVHTHRIVSSKTKRKIAAYTFGDPKEVVRGRIGGRKAFSKKFKEELIKRYDARDAFSRDALDERYLQIDHRIPYEVAGDSESMDVTDFMLIDASSQRAKSWSCENCDNFKTRLDSNLCKSCFWAFPESYTHICLSEKRRIDIVWTDAETQYYDKMKRKCEESGISIQDHIKGLLRK